MKPSCLILDEATSMLDPVSRHDFMQLVETLVHDQNMTVVNITHHMEEVLLADFVYVMSGGRVVTSGTPAEVFDQVSLVRREGLDVPAHTETAHAVASLLDDQLQPLEAASWDSSRLAILRLLDAAKRRAAQTNWRPALPPANTPMDLEGVETVVQVKQLSYVYAPGTAMETRALDQVSFDVHKGELLGIIGHSGSGKSTLIQHLNGLLRGHKGQVTVLGMDGSTNADIRKIRQRVGLLYQYPEQQLFEETVFQDIAFGPKRMGLDMAQIEPRVLKAARIVGLQDEELERSPYELSGGQKRRAAIAGVLAMEPEILILDEPAAGLDPAGRDEILDYAAQLRQKGGTIILVSHSMEDIARLADRVLVLRQGRVHAFGRTADVFSQEEQLVRAGLSLPRTTAFLKSLCDDLPALDWHCFKPEDAAARIVAAGMGLSIGAERTV